MPRRHATGQRPGEAQDLNNLALSIYASFYAAMPHPQHGLRLSRGERGRSAGVHATPQLPSAGALQACHRGSVSSNVFNDAMHGLRLARCHIAAHLSQPALTAVAARASSMRRPAAAAVERQRDGFAQHICGFQTTRRLWMRVSGPAASISGTQRKANHEEEGRSEKFAVFRNIKRAPAIEWNSALTAMTTWPKASPLHPSGRLSQISAHKNRASRINGR